MVLDEFTENKFKTEFTENKFKTGKQVQNWKVAGTLGLA